jgi:hypothetical protein
MQVDFKNFPTCIGVVGSRSFSWSKDRSKDENKRIDARMRETVRRFIYACPTDAEVVSGGARGIDRYAQEAAYLHGRRCTEYLPQQKFGSPRMFFLRNTEIVQHIYRQEGILVAFVDLDSHSGTDDTIEKALKLGVPTMVFQFTPKGDYAGYEGTLDLFVK